MSCRPYLKACEGEGLRRADDGYRGGEESKHTSKRDPQVKHTTGFGAAGLEERHKCRSLKEIQAQSYDAKPRRIQRLDPKPQSRDALQ